MVNYKVTDGKVNSLLKTGSNLVKNKLPLASAQSIVAEQTLVDSDIDGYEIHTGNGWYFEGTVIRENEKARSTKKRTK